ncbi:MAG: hypothetical protein WD770_00110 [Actinomycetota bacterium]
MKTPRTHVAAIAAASVVALVAILGVTNRAGTARAQIGPGTTPLQVAGGNVPLPANLSNGCVSIPAPAGKILTIESITVQITPVSAAGVNPGVQLAILKTNTVTMNGFFVPVPLSTQGNVRSGAVQTLVHVGTGIPSAGTVDPGDFSAQLCLRRNGATGAYSMAFVISGYLEPAGEVPAP